MQKAMNRQLALFFLIWSPWGLSLTENTQRQKDKSIIRSGVSASSYLSLELQNGIRKEDVVTPGLRVGWQFFRYDSISMALGYESTGIGGPSSYHGFNAELWLRTGDLSFSLSVLNGHGYFKKSRSDNDPRKTIALDARVASLRTHYQIYPQDQLIFGLGFREYTLNKSDKDTWEKDLSGSVGVVVGVMRSFF